MHRPGVKPRNSRRIISGILHVLKTGCRWRDCLAVFGPHTTVYNRFNRWSRAGIWQEMFERLVQLDHAQEQSIDSTTSKAHRCSAGGKGGLRRRQSAAAEADEPPRLEPLPVAAALFADTAYDSDRFRGFLTCRGTTPVIRPNPTRKKPPPFDEALYKRRNVIERLFSHLKDWRRVATRYDKPARNFRATVILAAILVWWT